jgi:hypothetical protein
MDIIGTLLVQRRRSQGARRRASSPMEVFMLIRTLYSSAREFVRKLENMLALRILQLFLKDE